MDYFLAIHPSFLSHKDKGTVHHVRVAQGQGHGYTRYRIKAFIFASSKLF